MRHSLPQKLHYPQDNFTCGANFTHRKAHLVENDRFLSESVVFWQGHKDLNPEPTVLETAALPIELYPYI